MRAPRTRQVLGECWLVPLSVIRAVATTVEEAGTWPGPVTHALAHAVTG